MVHVALLVEAHAVAGDLAVPLVGARRVPGERHSIGGLEPETHTAGTVTGARLGPGGQYTEGRLGGHLW